MKDVVLETSINKILTSIHTRFNYNISLYFYIHILSFICVNLVCLLQERVGNIALPQVKTFPVQIKGGYNAQVRLHLPPGLREDEITRYPLVVQV